MSPSPLFADTLAQMVREKLPNFFRPYVNPFVAQTCFCLGEYVRSTWNGGVPGEGGYQTFLANSFDEALSGAIKLVRYCANVRGRPAAGLVIDPDGRLGHFASIAVSDQERIAFVPNLFVAGNNGRPLDSVLNGQQFGFVVLLGSADELPAAEQDALHLLVRRQSPYVVTCVSRDSLANCRGGTAGLLVKLTPDVVVFDESFVNHEVPFGAFTARKELYGYWNRRGKTAFHSTTFQPNTVASLHFLRCLERADPAFHVGVAPQLRRIEQNPAFRERLFGMLYSRFLVKATRALGLDAPHVVADGHYVTANGPEIFDAVAGIACSVRGHNPEGYVAELAGLDGVHDLHAAASARLKELTGLEYLLPAVSGASAVENALRLALAAQYPKKYVLAFQGGFGGKTLLALTGTAKLNYKENLDPLYEHVIYIDPFGPNAIADLDLAFATYPVAVVQLELIQAVGGVRPIPAPVLEYLEANKRSKGYLLFVDEVQTAMYRTGPFALSEAAGVRPDLLTIGKGTSDMMFPFALTLYSEAVQARLGAAQAGLPEAIRKRYAYDWGYKTVLNVLAQAEATRVSERVRERGAQFAELLSQALSSCAAVRSVRVHGLLIAIELDTGSWLRRRLKKGLTWLYLLGMIRHKSFPLFAGFCQYEPNVLKLTPPLSITPDEVRQVCATIASVLRTPLPELLLSAARTTVSLAVRRRVMPSRTGSRP